MANIRADDHNEKSNQPVQWMLIDHWIVIADHQEDYWQSEVVVVNRAALSF